MFGRCRRIVHNQHSVGLNTAQVCACATRSNWSRRQIGNSNMDSLRHAVRGVISFLQRVDSSAFLAFRVFFFYYSPLVSTTVASNNMLHAPHEVYFGDGGSQILYLLLLPLPDIHYGGDTGFHTFIPISNFKIYWTAALTVCQFWCEKSNEKMELVDLGVGRYIFATADGKMQWIRINQFAAWNLKKRWSERVLL